MPYSSFAVIPLAGALALTATSTDTAKPVSVTVQAQGSGAREGGQITYRITVRDLDGKNYPNAQVVQLLNGALRYQSAQPSARLTGSQVVWSSGLAAGQTREFTMTAKVGSPADVQRGQFIHVVQPGYRATGTSAPRLSSTVCVLAEADGSILACGTDTRALAPADKPLGTAWWYAGGAALVGLLAAGWLFARRRRAALTTE